MEQDVKLTKLASCAGCGAKVGAGVLAKLLTDIPVLEDDNLLVGFDRSDDASVYRVSEKLAIVQTIDFFPPIVDDPYLFGRIAATNALSDIYAMGAEPKLALNVMCIPKDMPSETVRSILRGGYETACEAGVLVTGGHSVFDSEPKYGMSVTGFVHPDRILRNCGVQQGDVLLLTKPLGIGIYSTAARADLIDGAQREDMIRLMTALNKSAAECMRKYRVHACTDVTGFSLMGHLLEMVQGSGLEAHVDSEAVELLPKALSLAEDGILPEGMYRNRSFAQQAVDPGDVSLSLQDVFYDPQTSGGLLIAVQAEDADALYGDLKKCVPAAQRIGRVTAKTNDKDDKSIRLY